MAGLSGEEWRMVRVFLSRMAARAPATEREGAFDRDAPTWATWPEMGMHGDTCGRCGSWCEIVRPGMTQCTTCGDDDATADAIEAEKILRLFK